MKYFKLSSLLILFSIFYINGIAQTVSSETITAKEARQWIKHGAWRKNLQVKPHHSIHAQKFETQYKKHPGWWDKAFAFLNRKDLATLAKGTYPIVGKKVFASVNTFVPKDFKKSEWESHRKYADIQYMIKGKEKIGMAAVSGLTVTVPYNAAKDIAHYKGPGKYYVARPGTFFIFFPGDAHRPDIKVHSGDTNVVKKIVIKVQVSE